jgi:hypothetical protein
MELRTFTETWIEPVLRQIVQLEATYETDDVALTVAKNKTGIKRLLDEHFGLNFSVSVNVGMGAVSPSQRMQRIQSAIATVVSLIPDAAIAVKGPEVVKEVFGAAGFDNGGRFFDFTKAEAEKKRVQALEDAQANPQQAQPDPSVMAKLELQKQQMDITAQIEQGKLQLAQQKQEMEATKLQMANELQAKTIEELTAKINLLIAKTATENVTAVFEATQTAGVIAGNPGISGVSDEILKSSGFKDANEAPVVPEMPANAQPVAMNGGISDVQNRGNTHPNIPMGPPSARRGLQKGMMTPRIEV